MPTVLIGHVTGMQPGSTFKTRLELARAGLHRPTMAGIAGTAKTGAESIVISGGYEDDKDSGDEVIYTGQGGNDLNSKRQIADQTMTRGNAALKKSCEAGLPVRVIRGAGGEPPYAPSVGYRYDGLYRVEDYWAKPGRSGFRIWQFELVRHEGKPSTQLEIGGLPTVPAPRTETMVQRIVRNTAASQRVKELYGNRCQICGIGVPTKDGGRYSEGAHVRPLGRPHDGPDNESNILCLCPNHHAQLALGGLVIEQRGIVLDAATGESIGKLTSAPSHHVQDAHLAYRLKMKPNEPN